MGVLRKSSVGRLMLESHVSFSISSAVVPHPWTQKSDWLSMVHGPLPSRKLSVSHLGENKNHRNYHIPPGGKGKIILKYNPAPVEIGSLNLILQKGFRKKKTQVVVRDFRHHQYGFHPNKLRFQEGQLEHIQIWDLGVLCQLLFQPGGSTTKRNCYRNNRKKYYRIYINIPGTCLSPILGLQPSKTRSFPMKIEVIWVAGSKYQTI